jgi:hypothetical protein
MLKVKALKNFFHFIFFKQQKKRKKKKNDLNKIKVLHGFL